MTLFCEHQVHTAEARQLHPPARHRSHRVRHRPTSATRSADNPFKGQHTNSSGGRTHVCLELYSKGNSAYNENQNGVGRQTPNQCNCKDPSPIQCKTVHPRPYPLLQKTR